LQKTVTREPSNISNYLPDKLSALVFTHTLNIFVYREKYYEIDDI